MLLIVAVVKWRIEALEAALIKYVSIKTNYEYALEIDRSYIDFRDAELDFSKVLLTRVKNTNKKGIRSLEIPHVHIKLSSFKVFLYRDSLEIEKLVIDEPIVEIEKSALKKSNHESLAGYLVKLYPSSQEFLRHYRVHEFAIKRGGFGLQQQGQELVRVGLIDFYLYEWNVPDLTDKSQLKLRLGKQKIRYDRSNIEFSEINYSFEQKFIRLSDFNFSTADSAHNTAVQVRGKEILIDSIDYAELLNFERYQIKKLKIDQPAISLKISLQSSGKKISRDRQAITNILKSSIGEFAVDSVLVKKAQLELILKRGEDSLEINLPKVDLDLNNFMVRNDQEEFYLGGLAVSIPDTRIRLFNDLILACDYFYIDRKSSISIGGVRIYPGENQASFIDCERIFFKDFEFEKFAFEKELMAEEITLHKANIKVSPERIKQIIHKSSRPQKNSKMPRVDLNRFSMDKVDIFYEDEKRTIEVLGASCLTESINNRHGDSIRYELNFLAADKAIYTTADQIQKSVVVNFRHENKWLWAEEIKHTDRNFVLGISGAEVFPVELNRDNTWIKHTDTVRVKKVSIKGDFKSGHASSSDTSRHLSIDHLQVDNLQADLRFGDKHLSSSGKDLVLTGFDIEKRLLPFDQLSGNLYRVKYSDSIMSGKVDSVRIDLQKQSVAYNPILVRKGLKVKASIIEIRKTTVQQGRVELNEVLVRAPGIKKEGELLLFSDSIRLLNYVFFEKKKPNAELISLYNNSMLLLKEKKERGDFNPEQIFASSQLGPIQQLQMDSLTLERPSSKPMKLKDIDVKRKGDFFSVTCSQLKFNEPKFSFSLQGIYASTDKIFLNSISMVPDLNAFELQNQEADIIRVDLKSVSLLESRSVDKSGMGFVDVQQAKISIKRDKFLPDVAFSEKPFLLDHTLTALKKTGIKEVQLQSGELSYFELSDKTGREARVSLDSMNLKVKNIQHSYSCHLLGTTKIYNQGLISFDYKTKDSTLFELNAEVQSLDLTTLNQIVWPLEALEIQSGFLDKMTFSMNGKDESAQGEAEVSYRKLRLYIYDKKTPNTRTTKSTLISFVANHFVLRRHRKNSHALYFMKREKDVSVFGYWVKAAITGATKVLKKGKRKRAN
jgi:hypothetical protein